MVQALEQDHGLMVTEYAFRSFQGGQFVAFDVDLD